MKIEHAENPVWADEAHTVINIDVRFDEIPAVLHRYTAKEQDIAHSRELFLRALDGEFGKIAEHVPPPGPTEEQMAEEVRSRRDRLLRETDWTQLPDVPEKTKDAWTAYRQALRDVPEQPDFPTQIDWPEKP